MIPMECPSCGRQGEVPLDRLNSKLTCKKCGTVFHMDETGHIVLGVPGSEKKRAAELKLEPVDVDLGKMVRRLPKVVRYGVPLMIVGLLGVLVVSQIRAALGLAEDLPSRATFVGEEFVDQRLEAIQELATPETRTEVKQWFDRMRTRLNYQGARVNPQDVTVLGQVFSEDGNSAVTFTALHVAKPKAVASPGAIRGPLDDLTLEVSWVWRGGRWMIDGQATLVGANTAKSQRR